MKKIFALALAALMTAGMTTVAFAEGTHDVNLLNDQGNGIVYFDKDEDGVFEVAEGVAFGDVSKAEVDGGVKVAIPLYTKAGKKIDDKDDIKSWKVSFDARVGSLEEKPVMDELVKLEDGGYVYAVTFTLPENEGTKKVDLAGELTIYKSTSEKKDADAWNKMTFGLSYGYDVEEKFEGTFADPTKGGVVKFADGAEEIDIEFDDDAMFTVDVTGQGKLNLRYNRDFNKEFAAMYDYANIDFLTFEATPSFNKIGSLYIYADEDAFVYEVTADGAKKLDATWDEDYEAWVVKTRTLKSYAISDVELTEKTATEDKDDASSTTDGGKENPDTGR